MRKVTMTLMLAFMLALPVLPPGTAVAESWLTSPDRCDSEAGSLLGASALILVLGCPTNPDNSCPIAPSTEEPELFEEPGPVSGIMVDPMGKFNRPLTADIGSDCNGIASNTSVELNRLASLLRSIMACGTDEFVE